MYPIENSGDLIKNKRKQLFSRNFWVAVGTNVFFLGLTSLLTDISSEMVTATLPVYLLVTLRLAPLQFGLIDGINQGASVLVRIASGVIADRWRRAKEVATSGYAFSAICRIGLLLAGRSWLGISGVVLLDRIGKGIRTSPRDAMIAESVSSEKLATAFGVHRAMDTAGAMLGPLLAAGLLVLAPGAYDVVFIVSFCFAIVGVAVIGLLVEKPAAVAPAADSALVSSQIVVQLLARPDFRALVLISTGLALTTLSDSYIFLAGYGLLAVLYGLMLIPGLPQAVSLGLLVLLGLYYAATDGVIAALASTILPEQWRTTGLAIMTTGTGLARLLASLGYGALWTYLGPNPALTIFLIGLSVTVLLAWVFLNRVERNVDETVQ